MGVVTDYISDLVDMFENGVEATQRYYRGRLDNLIANHLNRQEEFIASQGGQARN